MNIAEVEVIHQFLYAQLLIRYIQNIYIYIYIYKYWIKIFLCISQKKYIKKKKSCVWCLEFVTPQTQL